MLLIYLNHVINLLIYLIHVINSLVYLIHVNLERSVLSLLIYMFSL